MGDAISIGIDGIKHALGLSHELPPPRPEDKGILHVRLINAVGLRSMDRNGFSDPYVKMMVAKKT